MADSSKTPTPVQTSVWQVENLRVTAFYPPGTQVEGGNWWTDLVGSPPEETVRRLSEQYQEGPFVSGRLLLRIDPTRIDWIFAAVPIAEGLPTLGEFSHLLKELMPLMDRWFGFPTCPPINRLAFGGVLFQPVTTLREGYKTLANYLSSSVRVDPDQSTDFFYQINRPRMSKILKLKLNRLSKWSVAARVSGIITVGVTPGTGPASVEQKPLPSVHACRLELDMNTGPEWPGVLPPNQLPMLIRELVSQGTEIANRGDIE